MICEKEFRASELNTKMKQTYLLEKKEHCENKLVEKRLARQAALEIDREYANMEEGEEEEVSIVDRGDGIEGVKEEENSHTTDPDGQKEEETMNEQTTDTVSDQQTVFRMSTSDNSSMHSADSGTSTSSRGACSDDQHQNTVDDEEEVEEEEEEEDCAVRRSDLFSIPSASSSTPLLTEREVRLFVKDYFNNSFPDRVVSHVTNHEGVNIYKNKLAMTKSKRREVLPAEVAANEKLLAQLPYCEDISSYKFYFVQ